MRFTKFVTLSAALMLGVAAAPVEKLPARDHFLFWTPAEQVIGYRSIEKIFPVRVINRGATVSALPHDAKPFDVSYDYKGAHYDTAAFMKANASSGLIIVKGGHVLLERYGLGRTEKDRWTSFSVGKSVTSTLVGAAIKDDAIKGLIRPSPIICRN